MQVGVEDISLKGRLRTTMIPMLFEMPIVGALQVWTGMRPGTRSACMNLSDAGHVQLPQLAAGQALVGAGTWLAYGSKDRFSVFQCWPPMHPQARDLQSVLTALLSRCEQRLQF